MTYGIGDSVGHLVKAVALFGVALTATLTAFLAIQELTVGTMTPAEVKAYHNLFNVIGVTILAMLTWSIAEFIMAIWSIDPVRRRALLVKGQVVEAFF